MKNHTNKIYATVNEKGIVIKLFSNVFETPLGTDKLIEEGNEEYHAHVHLKYKLTDYDGNYNYKYESDKMVLLTDEEKKILFPKPTENPDDQEILNAQLLKSNADIKTQLTEQQELTADLLLQIAKLKGGTLNV